MSDRRVAAPGTPQLEAWMRRVDADLTMLKRRKLQGDLSMESATIGDLTVTNSPNWVNGDIAAAANVQWSKLEAATYAKVGGSTTTLVSNTAAFLTWVSAIHESPYLDIDPSAPSQITVLVSGTYLIIGSILWGSVAAPAGIRQTQIFAAGSAQALQIQSHAGAPANTNAASTTSVIVSLAAGAIIQLQGLHTQGANITLANDNRTFLTAVYLGHL